MGLRKRVRALEKAARADKHRITLKWMEETSTWFAYAESGKYHSYYDEWDWSNIFLSGVSATDQSREKAFLECLKKLRKWQDVKLVPSDDETVVYV